MPNTHMRAPGAGISDLLNAELERRDLKLRGLARLLAGTKEHRDVEAWRRQLYRYRKGTLPDDEQARVIEERLGLEAGSLPRRDSGSVGRVSRADLESGLRELAGEVERLAEAVALLAAKQPPQLRSQLRELLEAEQP
jgi:hypothetical protein